MLRIFKSLPGFRKFAYSHRRTELNPDSVNYAKVTKDMIKDFSGASNEIFCSFVEKFHENFLIWLKDPSLVKHLQNFIKTRAETLDSGEVFSIINSITTSCKYSAHLPKELIEELLNRIIKTRQTITIKELRKLSNLIQKMNEVNFDNLYYFKTLILMIPVETVKTSNIEDLGLLCEVLSKLGMQSKFFDVVYENYGSVYQIIEEKMKSQESFLPSQFLFKFLKCFVINDRGDEDWVRSMEKQIFRDLKNVDDKVLADIPFFYHRRIQYGSSYIQDNLLKPTYLEFVTRFEKMNPLSKSLFLINYWKNSTYHGMYCDHQLKTKINQMFNKKLPEKYFSKQQKQHMVTTCLSYLAHARQIDSNFLKTYVGLIDEKLMDFNSNFFLKSGVYLSRYQETDPIFWESFLKHLPEMINSQDNLTSLYSIHLNLRLNDKKNFELISPFFDEKLMKNAGEKWKNARKYDLKIGNTSHRHNEIINILEKKKVKYETELYDEYFVDIALPDLKVCIEVCGPGHYLFPDIILNGRTENKRKNMEKLGWKSIFYTYLLEDYNQEGIESLIDRIIPLHF